MNLKWKLLISFGVFILLFSIILTFNIFSINNINYELNESISKKFEIDKHIREGEVIVSNIHSQIWDTVLFHIGKDKSAIIQDLNSKARRFYTILEDLSELDTDNDYSELRDTFKFYYQFGSMFFEIETLEEFLNKNEAIEKFLSNKENLIYLLEETVTNSKSEFENGLITLGASFERITFVGIIAMSTLTLLSIILAVILTNFITRPIIKLTEIATQIKNGDINLIADIKSKDEIGVLAVTFNQMISNLKLYQENLEKIVEERTAELRSAMGNLETVNRQLTTTRDALWGEMELAKKIQTVLLPKETYHKELEIAAKMIPAEEIGGDYYDIAYDKNQDFWISIGDVSGHGVTAGLIMMMAQTAHYNSLQELDNPLPKDIVSSVNRVLSENITKRLEETNFMTFTSIKYTGNGDFVYAGAHLDIIVHRHTSNKIEFFETSGTFLNLLPDISQIIEEKRLHLDTGDTMILYTDGVIESANKAGQLLDMTGLSDIIIQNSYKSVELLKQSIIDETMHWCGNEYNDDISVVVVRQK